jgi:hypothetical protein
MVVDQGSEKHCIQGAAKRNESIAKYGMEGEYIALPGGEAP